MARNNRGYLRTGNDSLALNVMEILLAAQVLRATYTLEKRYMTEKRPDCLDDLGRYPASGLVLRRG